jgi:hypothetical protein
MARRRLRRVFKLGCGFGFVLGLGAVGLAGWGIGSCVGLLGAVSLLCVSVLIDLSCEIDACNINSSICVCTCAFSSVLSLRIKFNERCTSLTALTAG